MSEEYPDLRIPRVWDNDTRDVVSWEVILGPDEDAANLWSKFESGGGISIYYDLVGTEEEATKAEVYKEFFAWHKYTTARDKLENGTSLPPDTSNGTDSSNSSDFGNSYNPMDGAVAQANTTVDQVSKFTDTTKLKSLMTKATMASKLFDYQPNCFDKSIFGTLVNAMAKVGTAIGEQTGELTAEVYEVLDQIEGQINAAVEAVKAAFVTPLIQHMKKYVPEITMDGSVIKDVLEKYNQCMDMAQSVLEAGLPLLPEGQSLIEAGMDKLLRLPFDALSNVVPGMKTPDQMIAVLGIKNKVKAKASEIFLKTEAGKLMNEGYDGIASLQSSLDFLSKESFFGDLFAEQYSSVVYPKIVGMIPNVEDVPGLTTFLGELEAEERINWGKINGELRTRTMIKSKTAYTDLVLSTKLPPHASLESMIPGSKTSTFGFIKRIKELDLSEASEDTTAYDAIVSDIFASDPDAPVEASQEIVDIAEGTYSNLLGINLEQGDFDTLFEDGQEPVLCLASVETKRYLSEGEPFELANTKGLLDAYQLELREQLVQEGWAKGDVSVAETKLTGAEEALSTAEEELAAAIAFNNSLDAAQKEIEDSTGGK